MLAKIKVWYRIAWKARNICSNKRCVDRNFMFGTTKSVLSSRQKVACETARRRDATRRSNISIRDSRAFFFSWFARPAAWQEVAGRSWKNDHDLSSFVSAANIARRDRKKRRCATRDRFARVRVEAAIYIRDARKKHAELLPKFPLQRVQGREREKEREKGERERERARNGVDCRGYFRMYIIDIINSMLHCGF